MKKILFVCLGNICRSPTAEGIFLNKLKQKGLSKQIEVDSAGILDTHRGELPDRRSREFARARGHKLESRSRPVEIEDFERFDLLVAMDFRNRSDLEALCPRPEYLKKIVMMGQYATPPFDEVPDPYFGGSEGFENVLDLLENATEGLMIELQK